MAAKKTIHFGAVVKTNGGGYASFDTLCGLIGDCNNRDPDATTCGTCKRSRHWDQAVKTVREAQANG